MNRTAPLSLRLTPEVEKRLEEMAERLGVSKHTIARLAVEAAVKALEENGGRIVVPIEFDITHVPTPKGAAGQVEHSLAEDRDRGSYELSKTNRPAVIHDASDSEHPSTASAKSTSKLKSGLEGKKHKGQ